MISYRKQRSFFFQDDKKKSLTRYFGRDVGRTVVRRESYDDDRSDFSRRVVGGETCNDERSGVSKTVVRRESCNDERSVVITQEDSGRTSNVVKEAGKVTEISDDDSTCTPIRKKMLERSVEDLKKVTENLNSGHPDDLISKNYLEMRRRDYRTLSGTNHLNDKVINEYFHLLQERSKETDLPSVYAMTTHVYTWLNEDYARNY